MSSRSWLWGGLGLLLGGALGFAACRLTSPVEPLVLQKFTSDVQATLAWRGVAGDDDGSGLVRADIVERCAKAPDNLKCLHDNYRFLVLDAENGNPDGMVATAMALMGSTYCFDMERAAFWFKKAHSAGRDVRKQFELLTEKSKPDRCQ